MQEIKMILPLSLCAGVTQCTREKRKITGLFVLGRVSGPVGSWPLCWKTGLDWLDLWLLVAGWAC